MKTKILGLITLIVLGTFTVFAGEKTEKFKVKGNCGMCEKRIEKAANSVEGVNSSDWDKTSKMITVVFNDAKTNTKKIEKAIANVGHDTPNFKAENEVYNNLPGCCKYDRSKKGTE